MKIISYFRNAFATTLNIIVNAFTGGKTLWLEGKVKNGIFRNWAMNFKYRPTIFAQPATEAELIDLIRNSSKIRVFGSAHSFNSGVVSDEVLISLDKWSGVMPRLGLPPNQVAFKSGTRVRDVVKILLSKGMNFKAMPSHDAQSIAGIISTDVHGTGKDWGFISELVTEIKLIDGKGDIHTLTPADELFKAAIGGIGAVGIISEVVVEAVPRFNVDQEVKISDLSYVEANLDTLLNANDHLSLYLFPFTEKCQINLWNRTTAPKSPYNTLREFLAISMDALLASWFGNLISYLGLLPRLSGLAHGVKKGTDLVMESNAAYNRTIYHLHQELEFTVPFEETFAACRKFLELYEELYREECLPYALLEVRFTPAGHNQTLIGAGRDRRCTWIDLIINDSEGFERFYDAAEILMKEIGARPHLGKFCKSFTKSDMQAIHGANFDRFLELVAEHDPDGKFKNGLTRRLFE